MNYIITAWLEGAETEGAAPPRPSAWCPGPQATTVGKERASARSGQRCQGHHPGPHDTAAGEERAFARKGQQRQVHRPGPQASTAGRYGRPAGPGPRRPLSKPRPAALEERLASGPAARAPSSTSQGLRVGRLTVGDRRNRRRTKKP